MWISNSSQLGTASLSEIALVVSGSELLLEPVDLVLEWVVILMMEEVASWLDLDEFFHHLSFWDVS